MTLKEIKDLWFYCYNEDLKTQYSGFYKLLKKLEKDNVKKIEQNMIEDNTLGIGEWDK